MKKYTEVFNSYIAKEFMEAAREYGKWCREEVNTLPPYGLELKYRIALHNYRVYLDSMGMKMQCKVYRQNMG